MKSGECVDYGAENSCLHFGRLGLGLRLRLWLGLVYLLFASYDM